MATPEIVAALRRVEAMLERRPAAGLHDDAPATMRWEGGMRAVVSHANGRQVTTDMPAEFGGTGDQVTPGWLFRAGLAACAGTSIRIAAATEGIELASLEVRASSRSDTRGLLGMASDDGTPVSAGPGDLQLHVRISAGAADAVDASAVERADDRLRAVVRAGVDRSPVPCALKGGTPLALVIDVVRA